MTLDEYVDYLNKIRELNPAAGNMEIVALDSDWGYFKSDFIPVVGKVTGNSFTTTEGSYNAVCVS